MEASKGNELPAVTHRCEVRDKALKVFFSHLLCAPVPVKAGREVVRQHLVGLDSVDTISEFLSHLKVGGGGFHPDEVAVLCHS